MRSPPLSEAAKRAGRGPASIGPAGAKTQTWSKSVARGGNLEGWDPAMAWNMLAGQRQRAAGQHRTYTYGGDFGVMRPDTEEWRVIDVSKLMYQS